MTLKKTISSSIVLPAMLFSASALAQDDPRNVDKSGPFFGEEATGKWLIGVKYGQMQHDADGFSAADNVGFMVGYEFSRPVFYGHAALEFEYLDSSSAGDFRGQANPVDPSKQEGVESDAKYPGDGNWENTVRSLYAVYRGPGTLYFKGKAGLTASKFEATFTNPAVVADDIREDKTTVGWGIGFGIHAGKYVDIELEYAGNQGNSDMNYISLGANARF